MYKTKKWKYENTVFKTRQALAHKKEFASVLLDRAKMVVKLIKNPASILRSALNVFLKIFE